MSAGGNGATGGIEAEVRTVCDSCGEQVSRSPYGGWWVGADDTSECPASPDGHTVDGEQR